MTILELSGLNLNSMFTGMKVIDTQIDRGLQSSPNMWTKSNLTPELGPVPMLTHKSWVQHLLMPNKT